MILGVDPGRGKTGWAFCSREGELLLSGITPTREVEKFCSALAGSDWAGLESWILEGDLSLLAGENLERVLLGLGTGSHLLMGFLESAGFSPEGVDESYTTLKGRRLYWELHPPRGLRRLLPLSLQIPPRNVDDLAAWALILSFIGA